MNIKYIAALLAAGFALSACDEPAASVPVEQLAPEVGIQVIQPQSVTLTTELPGRTSAFLVSEVRPQVGGIIEQRLFEEGADVTAGSVLYQIDPASYQAELDSARASLAKARANVTSLQAKARRYGELVAIDAVAKQDYDDAKASLKAAEAEIALAAADVKTAEINLAYTSIVAPISGRIGKSNVTQGALVTASQTTALATIQALDRIYVDVTQTSAEFLRLKRDWADGRIGRDNAGQAQVKLLLEDGSTYPHSGVLQFSDVTVDETTGSIALRAIFPNPDHDLLPGMYVRAVLAEGKDAAAILAPQRGVTRNSKGEATALVVGADGKAEQRRLVTTRTIGDQWLVASGLQAGDKLIVDGLQKVQPGTVVRTTEQLQKPAAPAAIQP